MSVRDELCNDLIASGAQDVTELLLYFPQVEIRSEEVWRGENVKHSMRDVAELRDDGT